MVRHSLLAVLFASLVAANAGAQINVFGQNKIHYRDFEWQVLRGEHVDLYFYPEEDELARLSLVYVEETFSDLEVKFGHSPRRRIPLIIYASHADFEQTNILPFVPPEGILGVTEFLKNRVALPFNGSYAQFRHTLRHELVHFFQLSIQSETRRRHPRRVRARLPLWWTEGLAEFWSEGEDTLDEMFLRSLTIEGRLPSLRQLTFVRSGLVYPLGGSIHRWLAERFGDWRVQVLYRDLWKYRNFADAIHGVYGETLEELDEEFRHFFRQRYFPAVNERIPLSASATSLVEFAIKPVAYRSPGDSLSRFLFMSPSTGYMNVYSMDWLGHDQQVVIRGERTAEFESLHPFSSRLDVRDGIAVFSSKYMERDALFFWNLGVGQLAGRYQMEDLVSMRSPSWAPDGQSVVFSGLTVGGYSDLHRLWLPEGRLERLTSDRYEDLDPSFSPDGTRLVFASDRTAYGSGGSKNLFVLDLTTLETRYLTYGPWVDQTPRWAEDGSIYFSSDRGGVFDIYRVDSLGFGTRETTTLTGAFDPQWVEQEEELVFTGFHRLTYAIFHGAPQRDSLDASAMIALPEDLEPPGWSWAELNESPYVRADPTPYEAKFSLDIAAGDAVVAPGVGNAQGALFLFSDLLSDHLLFVGLSSFQGSGFGNFIDNVNGTVLYLNQKTRLNWGVGAFRLRGLFLEPDLTTVFEETAFGGFGLVRWPISRFERVEAQFRLERSDRLDFRIAASQPRRIGWLASNFLSYVKDNSLWLRTGPIDGQRTNLTTGITNDLTNGRFDSWTLTGDHRRYYRVGLQSSYAVRAFGYYASGTIPRRISIGGPLALRGYPRFFGITGTRAWMINQELRFPITNFLSFGFPFGELRFPGIQGAFFTDLGGAWFENSSQRGILGSSGLGLRMPIVFPLVLRLDFGYRFEIGPVSGYGLLPASEDRKFVDFFVGLNY